MSDDQSFYEIQLNAPHLVLAVLGVAVVGVALFWLGVVIGRGQSGPDAASDWQAAVPAEQPQAGAGEDDPLEFYEAVSEPAAQDDTAADSATTPAQPEATTPPPASTPSERDFQPADPVAERPAPVMADSSTGLPREDPALVTGWIVQVKSTPESIAANALQAALVVDGFPAFVVSAEVNGETWYRVRVGRYTSRGDAQRVEAALLTRTDVEATWVTEG